MNICLKQREPKFKTHLSEDQCAQIDQWILEENLTYMRILQLVADQFHFHELSLAALGRYGSKLLRDHYLKAQEDKEAASSKPADKIPTNFLAKIEKRAEAALDDPEIKWTPERLLALQRFALEPWRRQILENRERHTRDMKKIAETNAQTKKDQLAWQKKYAQIKLTTPKGELPHPSLFQDLHPLNMECGSEAAAFEPSPTTETSEHDCTHNPTEPTNPTSTTPTSTDPTHPCPNTSTFQLHTSNLPADLCQHEPTCPTDFPCEHRSEAYQRRLAQENAAFAVQLSSESSSEPGQPGQPDYKAQFGEATAKAIRKALRLNPFWKVPTTEEQLHAACSTYVQLRDDEKFSGRRGRTVTQYKRCPCGGPELCPIHGEYPQIFWEVSPRTGDFVEIMLQKGFTWKWPRNSGYYILVDPEDDEVGGA